MSTNNNISNIYRDNEHKVDNNFADHIREKAAMEQMSVSNMALKEIHRFRDVTFWVNTQYDGSQLRLRNNDGKVITKLKKNAKINIVDPSVATDGVVRDQPDNDRGQGPDDSHIFVLVEADAADTEAGGNGKVQWWVSTEYIQSLGEPEPAPVVETIPPLIEPIVAPEEKPEEWTYPEGKEPFPGEPDPFKVVDEAKKDTPESPKPRPDILKPIETPVKKSETPISNTVNTVEAVDREYRAVSPVPVTQAPANGSSAPTENKSLFQKTNDKIISFWRGVARFVLSPWKKNIQLANGLFEEKTTTTTQNGNLVIKPTISDKTTTETPQTEKKEEPKVTTNPEE